MPVVMAEIQEICQYGRISCVTLQRGMSSKKYGSVEIAEHLRQSIRDGVYLPGSLLPTERELQEQFKVSRGTVRRSLGLLIESGWAESSPNRGVRAKVGPLPIKNPIVAFVDHLGTLRKSLFFALSRLLQENGFHLVHVDSAARGTEGALEYAAEEGFAAAVVWSKTGFPDAERVKAVQNSMPVIAVDHGLRNVSTDLVVCDNHEGSRTAVGHLARLGRKRIAISGMFDSLDVNQERFGGYLQALFDNGLKPDPDLFLFTMTSGMDQPNTRLLDLRLKDPDRPDAIFVLQDMSVPTVVRSVIAAGLRVPEDVAIVGFDNDVPIQLGSRGLTTVAADVSAVAEGCLQMIRNRIANPIAPFQRLSLPVELIVRGSCGAPKSRWVSKPYDAGDAKAVPCPPVPETALAKSR